MTLTGKQLRALSNAAIKYLTDDLERLYADLSTFQLKLRLQTERLETWKKCGSRKDVGTPNIDEDLKERIAMTESLIKTREKTMAIAMQVLSTVPMDQPSWATTASIDS